MSSRKATSYRLGLDLGTNSIGWCQLALDGPGNPIGLLDLGVRVFSDGRNPKDKTSLAVARRGPRSMRRRRDRYLTRRERLIRLLVGLGLMPADRAARRALEALDPYAFRAAAIDRPLAPHELGRALFHLGQRRGFKSNRKAEKADDKETGSIREAVSETRRRLEQSNAATLGQFLHRRRAKGETVRARAGVCLYPDRAMYAAEFDAIRKRQAPHHLSLDGAAWAALRSEIFFQRPLRPVDPGRCTLEPSELRAPRALPIAQQFRMLQEIGNLRVLAPGEPARHLHPAERKTLLAALSRRKELKFARFAKLLGLPGDTVFNLQDEKRIALKGDETAARLARKGLFGDRWYGLDPTLQTEIVETLLATEDEDAVAGVAMAEWDLDEAAARAVAVTPLPAGYMRVGRTALGKLEPILRDQGLRYDEAVKEAGYAHHSVLGPGEVLAMLPPYPIALPRQMVGGGRDDGDVFDRKGRIANPTVHIGLNQLRRLVNELIQRDGPPAEIVVELARDLKLDREQQAAIRERQARETRANERLSELCRAHGVEPTPELLRRLRLWEEQGPPQARLCPYSLEPISAEKAISGIEVDVDHIIPFALSLDDSPANKVICLRRANRDKGRRTPHKAFSHSPDGYDYARILANADRLPPNKRWRFHPDALERIARDGDFLDRQLNETRYLSRLAREYLWHVCPQNKVWVIPGQLTALLRGKWGLNGILSDANRKLRTDHRHHTIDAVVTALTDRALLQRVSAAAGDSRERLIEHMPDPPCWPTFREDVRARLHTMTVSYKQDRPRQGTKNGATTGALHNDTAYGLVDGPDAKGFHELVVSKPLAQLKAADLDGVRDPKLGERLMTLWQTKAAAGFTWPQFVELLSKPTRDKDQAWRRHGIRSVRVLERLSGIVAVRDGNGHPYKAYKADGNDYMEIYRLPNGRWRADTVRTFDANQKGFVPEWRRTEPEATPMMRLYKDDMVAIGNGAGRRLLRVVKFSGQTLTLAEHQEGGALKARDADRDDPFRYVQKSAGAFKAEGLRRVHVDAIGRVRDPGPPR